MEETLKDKIDYIEWRAITMLKENNVPSVNWWLDRIKEITNYKPEE